MRPAVPVQRLSAGGCALMQARDGACTEQAPVLRWNGVAERVCG